MEVVWAYKQAFISVTSFVETNYYDQEFDPIKFTSGRKDRIPRKAYMELKGSVEIQKEATKILKVSTIVPYKMMGGPIIEEIDDG